MERVLLIEILPNCDPFDEDKFTKQYMLKYGIQKMFEAEVTLEFRFFKQKLMPSHNTYEDPLIIALDAEALRILQTNALTNPKPTAPKKKKSSQNQSQSQNKKKKILPLVPDVDDKAIKWIPAMRKRISQVFMPLQPKVSVQMDVPFGT